MSNELISRKQEIAPFKSALELTIKSGIKSIPHEINADRLKLNAIMAIDQDEGLRKHAISQPIVIAQYIFNFVIQGLDMLNREAYIVPYKGKLTPVIDYKGLKKIAQQYSVKPIKIILSGVVRKNDTYINKNGIFNHEFDPFQSDKDRGIFIGAYCTIKYTDGEEQSVFVNADEVNKVKKSSPSSKSDFSPWNSWEETMWEKTVIRKAMKYVNLDFGGNENLAKAYRDSDKEVEFKQHDITEQDEPIDIEYVEVKHEQKTLDEV